MKNFTTACPKCGSKSVHTEADVSFVSGKPGFHVCNDCQFSAPLFPKISAEEREKLGKLKAAAKNKSPNQPGVVNGRNAILAAIGIIVIVVFGILGFVALFGAYFAIRKHLRKINAY